MVPKRVIISGVNGQLGQYLVKYLLENEPEVQILGTVRHKSFDNQEYIFDKSKITFELMDLSDSHSIDLIISKYKPDYFINTAANAFVGESWKVPMQHYQLNCLAVLHQLEAIRKYSPHTRYFNMGTSEEFGEVQYSPQDEKHPAMPNSPYGASKCAARNIVRVYRNSYNLYAIQGWTFNFESMLRGEKYVTRKITKNVARIYKAIQNNQSFHPLELGNVNSCRSWQHAMDVAEGIWRQLNQEKYRRETFVKNWEKKYPEDKGKNNVGLVISDKFIPKEYVLSSPETHTVKQFCEWAFEEVGIKGEWVGGGLDEHFWYCSGPKPLASTECKLITINKDFYRPFDVSYLHGDASAIKNDLGWEPRIGIRELIKEMVSHDLSLIST